MELYRGARLEEAEEFFVSNTPRIGTCWTPDRATADQYADSADGWDTEPRGVLEYDATGEAVIDWDHPDVQRYRPAWLPADTSRENLAMALADWTTDHHIDELEDYLWIRVRGGTTEEDVWVAL